MTFPRWRHAHVDMLFHEFANATRTYRELVITPACAALAEKEPTSLDVVLPLADYLHAISAIEGRKALTLSLAGLWESQFREHLRFSAAILMKDALNAKFDRMDINAWEDLFFRIRGFQPSDIPEYRSIHALVLVANAARHGNGTSNTKVFKDYSEFTSSQPPHAGWYSYFLHGGTKYGDARYISVSADQLQQFARDIEGFWEALAHMSREGARADEAETAAAKAQSAGDA